MGSQNKVYPKPHLKLVRRRLEVHCCSAGFDELDDITMSQSRNTDPIDLRKNPFGCGHRTSARFDGLGVRSHTVGPLNEALAERVGDAENRPLLRGRTPEERVARIRELLEERESAYRQAHLTLDTEVWDANELARQLEEGLLKMTAEMERGE